MACTARRSILCILLLAWSANAADYVWQGSGGVYSGTWTETTKWIPAGWPGGGDTATLDLTGMGLYTVTLDTSASPTSVTVNSADASLIIDGGYILTINGGAFLIQAGTAQVTATGSIKLQGFASLNTSDALTATTGAVLTVDDGVFADGVTLPLNLDVQIPGNLAAQARVSGMLTNETTVNLAAGAYYQPATVYLTDDVSITGNGTFQLNSSNYNFFSGAGPYRLTNVNNTIQGNGRIGADTITFTNQSQGLINSNDSNLTLDSVDSGVSYNEGTIQANGGNIGFSPGTYDNTGGTIQALSNSVSIADGAILGGGLILATGNGTINVNGTVQPSTARGVTTLRAEGSGKVVLQNDTVWAVGGIYETADSGQFEIRHGILEDGLTLPSGLSVHIPGSGGSQAKVSGTLTNETTVNLAAGAYYQPASVYLTDDVSITGNGTFQLNSSNYNFFSGAGPYRLTNVNNTIQGNGRIGADTITFTNQSQGLINSNDSNLTFDSIDSGVSYNEGTIQANGGNIGFSPGTYDNTGGTIQALSNSVSIADGAILGGGLILAMGNGTINVSGTVQPGTARGATTLRAEGSGKVVLQNDTVLAVGGIYETADSGQFEIRHCILEDGLTLPSGLSVHIPGSGGSQAKVSGTLNNETTINMWGGAYYQPAHVYLTDDVSITGNGTFQLSTSVHNYFQGAGPYRLTNVDNTIQGGGRLGIDIIAFTNQSQGLINSNVSSITLDSVDSEVSYNEGTIQANGGSIGFNPGTYDNTGGTIQALSNSVSIQAGTLIIGGYLDTDGSGTVQANSCTLRNIANLGTLSATSVIFENQLTNIGTLNTNGQIFDIGSTLTVKGSGLIQGNVSNSGRIIPGDHTDPMDITGNYTQNVDGTLKIVASSLGSNQLVIDGTAELDGTLLLVFDSRNPPILGSQFTVLTATVVNGEFNVGVYGSCDLDVAYLGNEVNVTIQGFPMFPDFDSDNRVTVLDLVHQMQLFGSCPGCDEDLDCSATVDAEDVTIAAASWAMTN